LLDVRDVISAPLRGGAAALAEVFEFGEAFDEGEREEEEDAEAAEPGGGFDAGSGRAGEDANGVKAGEDDDVDENHPLQAERIAERGDSIDDEPAEEGIEGLMAQEVVRQAPEGFRGDALDDVRQADRDRDRGE
jgi:hypothetical protein